MKFYQICFQHRLLRTNVHKWNTSPADTVTCTLVAPALGQLVVFNAYEEYYTIIGLNEVDMRIYQPEKVNITFKGRSTEIVVNTCNCFVRKPWRDIYYFWLISYNL